MPSAKVTFNGKTLAESDATIVIKGNHYFPPESVMMEHFTENETTTVCPWKGAANYYDLRVEERESPGGAWTYHDPKSAASRIEDYVAFYPDKVDAIE